MLGFYRIDLAKARRRYLICRSIFTGDLPGGKSKIVVCQLGAGAALLFGRMANFASRSIDNITLKLY